MDTTAPHDRTATQHVVIVNSRGLHARAAAKFVKLAGTFNAEIITVSSTITASGNVILNADDEDEGGEE